MSEHSMLTRSLDIKGKYLSGGQLAVGLANRRKQPSQTGSSRGKVYVATPPATGWAGGMPEHNGLKGRSK